MDGRHFRRRVLCAVFSGREQSAFAFPTHQDGMRRPAAYHRWPSARAPLELCHIDRSSDQGTIRFAATAVGHNIPATCCLRPVGRYYYPVRLAARSAARNGRDDTRAWVDVREQWKRPVTCLRVSGPHKPAVAVTAPLSTSSSRDAHRPPRPSNFDIDTFYNIMCRRPVYRHTGEG